MPRSKNYQSKKSVMPADRPADEQNNALINLPKNPRAFNVIDLRPYLGQKFDNWIWAFASVLRSLIGTGNFSITTIVALYNNGIRNFMRFLMQGHLHSPPKSPDKLTSSHLKQYIQVLKVRYPNNYTARNYYAPLKTLLTALSDYGYIRTPLEDLVPINAFPGSENVSAGTKPFTSTEMDRLARATKSDLIAIHQNKFPGTGSEAITVMMLVIAMRTGINTTPLIEMSRDCLKPHPFMPNLMLIHTVKRRGKGAQSQSIRQTALQDKQTTIRMDGVAILRKAIEMTDNLVDLAPKDLKNRIWLYRSGQPGHSHVVTCINMSTIWFALNNFSKRHGLLADDGEPLRVTFSALRKTMENRLWKLSNGDLATVASIMGHTPQVADNHYLSLDEESKAEGAKFIGTVFTEKLRGLNLAPTPSGSCKDSLHGVLAPKDGKTHCEQFTHCFGCPSYAIVGTHDDLYRLFSFQVFLSHEIRYYTSLEWSHWREYHSRLFNLIDDFTRDKFASDLVATAKAAATSKPHPFWAVKIQRLISSREKPI